MREATPSSRTRRPRCCADPRRAGGICTTSEGLVQRSSSAVHRGRRLCAPGIRSVASRLRASSGCSRSGASRRCCAAAWHAWNESWAPSQGARPHHLAAAVGRGRFTRAPHASARSAGGQPVARGMELFHRLYVAQEASRGVRVHGAQRERGAPVATSLGRPPEIAGGSPASALRPGPRQADRARLLRHSVRPNAGTR